MTFTEHQFFALVTVQLQRIQRGTEVAANLAQLRQQGMRV